MAFFPGSSSSSTPSATPRAIEEDHRPFSASSSTGQEYKTIIILGVSINIPMTETTSTTTTTTTGETGSVSLDFTAVDETIPAVISPYTQESVVQPLVNLPVNHHEGYWRIKKTLKKSDVDGSSRLLLGRQLVKDHILPNIEEFDEERGVEITVYDVDTRTVHTLLLKTWITNSYVLVNGWMKDFVRRRVLRKNDEIGLRWEETDGRFEFSLLRQHPMHQDSS
ncbi:B3 domain-containing protein At5g26805-like [Primulina huaijiensis]|uniref:B3 domain-containing protein At5g26805-like n=1 Tax=Primulina huaijiensis TaxID=1492673 RepID=UPI003CC799EC